MNSESCARPASLASGTSRISASTASTMARLYSNPPSSRSTPDRKASSARYLAGNLTHSARTACTTTTLNSSASSDMKPPICLSSRSTDDSLPVLSRVVMARVAMERLGSEMSASMSMLHPVTASGCAMATALRVRTAAKRSTGLAEPRKSWRTVTAGVSSREETSRMPQMARAASKMTSSDLWRRHDSRKSWCGRGSGPAPASEATCAT